MVLYQLLISKMENGDDMTVTAKLWIKLIFLLK